MIPGEALTLILNIAGTTFRGKAAGYTFSVRTRGPSSSSHCMETFHDNDQIAIRSLTEIHGNRSENCLFFGGNPID